MAHSDSSKSNFSFNDSDIEIASAVLRALAHPLRLELLNFLSKNGRTKVSVIYTHLKLNQSIASQQLRILRDVNLVIPEPAGKEVHYHLNEKRLVFISEVLDKYFMQLT